MEPVSGMANFDVTVVRPQTTVKLVVAPELPEMKSLSVRRSPEKDSFALRMKKFEFSDFKPFSVNATAIVLVDPTVSVFLTTMNFDTNPNSSALISPSETVEDVTKGVADMEYGAELNSPCDG